MSLNNHKPAVPRRFGRTQWAAAWILTFWITGCAARDGDSEFPDELVRFVPYGGNPIFQAAGEGHWDQRIRERGWIIKDDDGWRLWYTGYDGTREGKKTLGLATSNDGLRWSRNEAGPVYDEVWVEDMQVVKHGDKYYMFAEGLSDRTQLLESSDGVKWERIGTLDVRLKDGDPIPPGPYGTPTVIFEDERWFLFYERNDEGIWLATSNDMQVWRNVQDEPVIQPGPGQYDRDWVAMNQVIKHDGRYYAYYHGAAKPVSGKPTLWSTAVAMSRDLIQWEKYAKNPLFPIAENKSSGIVVHDGKRFRLYTMHDKVDVHLQVQK